MQTNSGSTARSASPIRSLLGHPSAVHAAIATLPERLQSALDMLYVQGVDSREACRAHGVSIRDFRAAQRKLRQAHLQ